MKRELIIQIRDLSLLFPNKLCFESFSSTIMQGSRTAIIGRSGSGKSLLLKILRGTFEATSGEFRVLDGVTFGYVPQIIEEFEHLSGGQRVNKALTRAISINPDILLLDEITNNLDINNRKKLIQMLHHYNGTVILVSHDTELIRNYIDTIWHFDNGIISVFHGNYDNYMQELHIKRASIKQELLRLKQEKNLVHLALMREQNRAAKSKAKGKKSIAKRKWSPIMGGSKASSAEAALGRKKIAINLKKQDLNTRLSNIRLPETILPRFSLSGDNVSNRTIVSIRGGSIGYQDQKLVLRDIHLSIYSKERIAIIGNNGSGKSTLIKGILRDLKVVTIGTWHVPRGQDIGYLAQDYETLTSKKFVYEIISELVPHWSNVEVRAHLNEFLFRTQEEVSTRVSQLSGGEKARLSLAKIAAKPPKLLILDEVTNNLDIETKGHVINVLKEYLEAMIIISHDEGFLKEVGNLSYYAIKNEKLMLL